MVTGAAATPSANNASNSTSTHPTSASNSDGGAASGESNSQQQTTATTSTQAWSARRSEHPLIVMRRKLDAGIITEAEFDQMAEMHMMMQGAQRTVVREGEMYKLGRRLGGWKIRWFVLYSDMQFCSCRSEAQRDAPTSTYDLSKCLCMPHDDPGAVDPYKRGIKLTGLNDDTSLVVAAQDLDDQIDWLTCMLTVKQTGSSGGRMNQIKAQAELRRLRRLSVEMNRAGNAAGGARGAN